MTTVLSAPMLAQIMGCPQDRADQCFSAMVSAMTTFNITTSARITCFLTQVRWESTGLVNFAELAMGDGSDGFANYEGRTDLGNTHPGDGVKYKGSGPIQVTGRANFEDAQKALDAAGIGINIVDDPDLARSVKYGFWISCWWWKAHGGNEVADRTPLSEASKDCGRLVNRGNADSDLQAQGEAGRIDAFRIVSSFGDLALPNAGRNQQMITVDRVLTVARSTVGYNGGGTEDAPDTKFGVWMGFNPAQWCASWVSWVLADGGTNIAGSPIAGSEYAKGFAYCPSGWAWFKAQGRGSTDFTKIKAGDIGFQNFGNVDGVGQPSHTWICETDYDPSSGGFWTIQGNTTDTSIGRTGNTCRRKFVYANDSHNIGFGHPAYGTVAAPSSPNIGAGAPVHIGEDEFVMDAAANKRFDDLEKLVIAGNKDAHSALDRLDRLVVPYLKGIGRQGSIIARQLGLIGGKFTGPSALLSRVAQKLGVK